MDYPRLLLLAGGKERQHFLLHDVRKGYFHEPGSEQSNTFISRDTSASLKFS